MSDVGVKKMGRPAIPDGYRRSAKLTARTTRRVAAAAQHVAALEGRSLASLVRVSVLEYCRPRLAAERAAVRRPFVR